MGISSDDLTLLWAFYVSSSYAGLVCLLFYQECLMVLMLWYMQEGHVLGHPCQLLAVRLLLSYQLHMSGRLTKCWKVAVGFGMQKSFHPCRKWLCLTALSCATSPVKILWIGHFRFTRWHTAVLGVLLYELYSVLFRSNVVDKSMKRGVERCLDEDPLGTPRLRQWGSKSQNPTFWSFFVPSVSEMLLMWWTLCASVQSQLCQNRSEENKPV